MRRWTSAGERPRSLDTAFTLFFASCLVEGWLWARLYLRPNPLGAPFALDPAHYLPSALYYGVWAQLLVALPFLARARYLPSRLPRAALALQLVASTSLLTLGAIDRECQRFLGMHVGRSWISTYVNVSRVPDVIWGSLAEDRGGAWSSVIGVAVAVLTPGLALLVARRFTYGWASKRVAWTGALLFLVLPTILWNCVPGGKLRQSKVRPSLLLAIRELMKPPIQPQQAAEVARAITLYQRHFSAIEGDGKWQFDDPDYPLRKHFVGPARVEPTSRPNFIVLQLETFRAKDMKSMNPAHQGAPPTPFLDSLASAADSMAFRRYYASGVPTVHAFMALHSSLIMHPSRSIPVDATVARIDSIASSLRRNGYQALHFTGSDPDWDSQRVWLNRWYDEVHYHPSDRERDRLTFQRAARRIREVAANGGPFLAHLSSITNHTPFHMPEPQLAIEDGSTTIGALHNTMRYTDDVVREFYGSLQREPWFANTIWIIVGDHGFDLGERGESGGHDNLRHETTWVPLIIHGAHALLSPGYSSCIGSHVDIAPTIAELAAVRDENSYMGHSLLQRDCAQSEAIIVRGGNYAYETQEHSLFSVADTVRRVYEGSDLVQQRELASAPAELLLRADSLVTAHRDLIRFVIDNDRVVPPTSMERDSTRTALLVAPSAREQSAP